MYTEENEFDYNEYIEEAEQYNNSNKKSIWGLILKIVLIIICIVLIIFIVFKIKNRNLENNQNNTNESILVFNNNMEILRSIAEDYYFENGNKPKDINEEVTLNVRELIDKGLITEIKDYDGSTCGYNTSYISMTRNKNDYMLEIHLLCSSMENSVVYYYDLDGNCLTCNGETYIPSDEDPIEQDNNNDNQEEDKKEDNNTNDDNQNSDNSSNDTNNTVVCGVFGNWTDEYIEDSNLEVETRTLVIGYKPNITYGEWSPLTTIKINETDTLDVETVEKEETITTKSKVSSESTKKPASKKGREIFTRKVTTSYYDEECSTKTTTKTLTYWDNQANSCTINGIGSYTCTYKKKVCNDVKKYKTTTYYSYQDTITSKVTTTYYKSRDIIQGEPSYTDYILENEMPDGYQKVVGSDKIQYRYKEKCLK